MPMVPHAAGVGKPTRGRPLWFPGPRPRPNAMLHSRMASGSHRRARAARFVMKRSVAERAAVGPGHHGHPHQHRVVVSAPALQPRNARLGAACVSSLAYICAVDRVSSPAAGGRTDDPPNSHLAAQPAQLGCVWAAKGGATPGGSSRWQVGLFGSQHFDRSGRAAPPLRQAAHEYHGFL